MHECLITDCGVKIRTGLLMCWSHWRGVPHSTQLTVNRTWRRINLYPVGDAHLPAALEAYTNAREDARRSIEGE